MDPKKSYNQARDLLKEHHDWMKNTVNLIASENVPSPAVREALTSDFGNRYAEGAPGKRVYAGCKYIDEMEFLAMDLAKEVYGAATANVQPISGVLANLAVYTAFSEPGDTMMALPTSCGGHISMAKKKFGGTAGAVHGLNIEYIPFDEDEMNIDVDKAKEKIAEVEPEILLFGASVFLFPHPVEELAEVGRKHGAKVVYDAAHVAGLIAGNNFQDPIAEGVDIMNCSTHKTLPGPQHGMILSTDEDLKKDIDKAVFPGVVSNHHLHAVAGVTISLAEILEFGEEYTDQIVKNAKALAESLYDKGFDVVGADNGFTQSHTVLADITDYGLGGDIEKDLEKANVIMNRNLLPWDPRNDRHYENPGGIRLGVSEVTRLGMEESQMEDIADFIARVVVEDEDPEKVRKDVEDFAQDYQEVNYCFDSAVEAYEYIDVLSS